MAFVKEIFETVNGSTVVVLEQNGERVSVEPQILRQELDYYPSINHVDIYGEDDDKPLFAAYRKQDIVLSSMHHNLVYENGDSAIVIFEYMS
jgi:hypothetical protein